MRLLGRTDDDNVAQADSKAMASSTLPNAASVGEMPLRLAMNGASLSRSPHEQRLPATKGIKPVKLDVG